MSETLRGVSFFFEEILSVNISFRRNKPSAKLVLAKNEYMPLKGEQQFSILKFRIVVFI
jgi:hypothetical protein